MALIDPPAFLGLAGNTYPAARLRRVHQLMLGGREGCLGPGDMAVTQTDTPSLSVQVAAGSAIVNGDDSTRQGAYIVDNDAAATVGPVSTPHTTLARIDRLVLEVLDKEGTVSGGGGRSSDLPQYRIVAGTPSASPVPPAEPPTAITLALITVAAGASVILNASITDTRSVHRLAPQWIAADIADAAVTTAKLADGAVTFDKIGDGQIGASKIGTSAVASSKIADGAVTATKIADGSVTAAKLDGILSGSQLTSNAPQAADNTAIGGLSVTPPAGTYLLIASVCLELTNGLLAPAPAHARIRRAGSDIGVGYSGWSNESSGSRRQVTVTAVAALNGSQQITVVKDTSPVATTALVGQSQLSYVRIA